MPVSSEVTLPPLLSELLDSEHTILRLGAKLKELERFYHHERRGGKGYDIQHH